MPPLATVGILSIGEMGMGIAKLLIAHNYRVVTNIEGRRWAFCSISQCCLLYRLGYLRRVQCATCAQTLGCQISSKPGPQICPILLF